jgi:hypothetical protein
MRFGCLATIKDGQLVEFFSLLLGLWVIEDLSFWLGLGHLFITSLFLHPGLLIN